MRDKMESIPANFGAFPAVRFIRLVLMTCLTGQLAYLTSWPSNVLAAENQEMSSPTHANSAEVKSLGDSQIIALRSMTTGATGGRPANFYRLESGSSESCGEILRALNAPYESTAHLSATGRVADMFLGNTLSVKWQELRPNWVGAAKLNIGPSGSEEWVVKEEEISPWWGEVLYWLPPGVDPTKLMGKDFWPGIRGRDDEQARMPENEISVMPVPKDFTDPKKIPVVFWDVVSVNGKALVLMASIANDTSPQRVTIHVLAMQGRRDAHEICRIATKALISGFSF